MVKTRQVLSVQLDDGRYYICVRDYMAPLNEQYKLYYKWWDQGWKRKKVLSFRSLYSVMQWFIDHKPN